MLPVTLSPAFLTFFPFTYLPSYPSGFVKHPGFRRVIGERVASTYFIFLPSLPPFLPSLDVAMGDAPLPPPPSFLLPLPPPFAPSKELKNHLEKENVHEAERTSLAPPQLEIAL
jgi:hypothetical protein